MTHLGGRGEPQEPRAQAQARLPSGPSPGVATMAGQAGRGQTGRPDRAQAAARRLADDVYRRCEPFRQLTADDADPFEAELQGAVLLNDLIEAWSELDAAMGMTTVAARHPEPHVAAAVAAVHHLSPGMAYAMALQDLKARGLAPPAWADRLGHVTPRRVWHYEDTFGEQEIFLASFAYDERAGADGEHAVLVEVARSPDPRLQRAHPSRTIDELLHRLEALRGCDGRPLQEAPLGWVRVRARLAEALARPHRDCTTETLIWSRLVRTRLRVLPEPGPAGDSPLEAPRPTATDRAAAVRSFLARAGTYQTGTDVAGTEPLAEVSPEVLAFWARVLVACTGAHASSPTGSGRSGWATSSASTSPARSRYLPYSAPASARQSRRGRGGPHANRDSTTWPWPGSSTGWPKSTRPSTPPTTSPPSSPCAHTSVTSPRTTGTVPSWSRSGPAATTPSRCPDAAPHPAATCSSAIPSNDTGSSPST